MEEIFKRFAGLGQGILDQIDDKNLAKSRKINQRWKNFIDQEKTIWIWMINKTEKPFSLQDDEKNDMTDKNYKNTTHDIWNNFY